MDIIRMREVCQTKKVNKKGKIVLTGHWYNRLITRKFSIYITRFFVKNNVSANTVTVIMVIFGIIAVLLSLPHLIILNIFGFLSFLIFEILDCVDGEVARWNKQTSIIGYYIDLISHVFCTHFARIILPLHMYFWKNDPIYLSIAFIAYSLSISEHSVRKCKYQACSNVSENDYKNISKNKKWTLFLVFFRNIADRMVFQTASCSLIMSTYFLSSKYMLDIVYAIVVYFFLNLVFTIFNDVYYEIPKMKHVKNL